MKHPISTNQRLTARRFTARRFTAALVAATLTAAAAITVLPAQARTTQALTAQADVLSETQPTTATRPETIPSLENWVDGTGAFSFSDSSSITIPLGNQELDGIAAIFNEELVNLGYDSSVINAPAEAGDISLVLDPNRTDLGAEGYQLTIADHITVTGATYAGTFYGTRTVLQMLKQQPTLKQGEVVDIPQYTERGVTLCACVINISPEFIDRLIEEMAFLKLNTLMVELKLKVDGYPETNTWSYYTKDQISALVSKAAKYGIDVIPEINSPGHMEIWLENLPDLQLTNASDNSKDEVRLDITKQEAFDFYTDLMDEYMEVFDSEYWHMGLDEYMLGSGYSNYPQMKQFAISQWGPNATEDDLVAWYANKINAYVKAKGKTLRIWNDGVIRNSQIVTFDTDIIVEHWNNAASNVAPQTFVNWGHDVVNVSNSLYMVRGSYTVNTANLYNGNWNLNTFYNGNITSGTHKVRGARMSLWPDGGTPNEAENQTELRTFEPLRFVSQMTWNHTKPWPNYSAFKTAMDTIGRPTVFTSVNRQPLPSGSYEVSAGGQNIVSESNGATTLGSQPEALNFEKSTHGYYLIKNSAGQCLDLTRQGTMRLNVPVEIGVGLSFTPCGSTTLQKWQLRGDGQGFTIANAASQQYVSVSSGLVDVPVARADFKSVPNGLLVQTPSDWGRTVWNINGGVALSAVTQNAFVGTGDSTAITVEVSNTTGSPLSASTLTIKDLPRGWSASPAIAEVPSVPASQSTSVSFTVKNVSAQPSAVPLRFELHDDQDQLVASASVSLNAVCSAAQIRPSSISAFSSQQMSGEPAPSGPAAAAIDGNPATYWHSQWSPSTAQFPHAVVIALPESTEICGLWYTGRNTGGSGGANGRIGDYEVYVSNTVSTVNGAWGDPVASGTFANSGSAQLAGFEPSAARYVKLVALNEVHGNPWATIAELAVAGPYQAPVATSPSVSVSAASAEIGGSLDIEGSDFEPFEIVNFTVSGPNSFEEELSEVADANGELSVTFNVTSEFPVGAYVVEASGWASGTSASAQFDVVAAPVVCSATPILPSRIAAVSSQQTNGEPAPNGHAAAAIDGNPATYWHSQWSPTEAQFPHSIVIELSEPMTVCGLVYTGRTSSGSGGTNGRIGDYEVYASETVNTVTGAWGTAIDSGTLANSGSAQVIDFDPLEAKYLKLVALNEVNGKPWASIGELAVTTAAE